MRPRAPSTSRPRRRALRSTDRSPRSRCRSPRRSPARVVAVVGDDRRGARWLEDHREVARAADAAAHARECVRPGQGVDSYVTITGSGFAQGTTVQVGNTLVNIISPSSTQIVFEAPALP